MVQLFRLRTIDNYERRPSLEIGEEVVKLVEELRANKIP